MAMRVNVPPKLQSSIQTARSFYARHNALPLYEHARNVLKRAQEHRIVEKDIIEKHGKNIKRARLNSILAETILYHPVRTKALDSGVELPDALTNEDVRRELMTFNALNDLNRRGAPLSEYVPLLNNGPAPLATLVMVGDYAVTHSQDTDLENYIKPDGHPIFRMYSSRKEALELLRMDAKSGEKLWAPIAELLGHPPLAGDILEHAYEVKYPDIHSFVNEKLRNEEMQEKLDITRNIAKSLARRLNKSIKGAGFEVEVIPRLEKHGGKIMRKVRKKMQKFHEKREGEDMNLELDEFIERHLHKFDLIKLHDLVALRVIVNKFGGREIDKMEEKDKELAIQMAVGYIESNITALRLTSESEFAYDIEYVNKESGYEAVHIDAQPVNGTNSVRFEVQLRTIRQHWIAEEGGAAHWMYIGGDSKFGKVMKQLYHDIIYTPNGEGGSVEDRQLIIPYKQ